jgi:hypothetical protein
VAKACLRASHRQACLLTGRYKEEIMRLKNSVPECLCASGPQTMPFKDRSWLFNTAVVLRVLSEYTVIIRGRI